MRKKEMNYFAELSDNEQSNLLHDALSKCKKNKKKLNGNNLLNELKRSIQRYKRENKSRQQVRDYDYINKISKDIKYKNKKVPKKQLIVFEYYDLLKQLENSGQTLSYAELAKIIRKEKKISISRDTVAKAIQKLRKERK
ncbi:MAG: hypothetical protein SPF17_04570 [Candidatus Mucispirillum faecigallinarum]|nr:hypothetical protein [Candidatus Mucispirillum faecigallinarum]